MKKIFFIDLDGTLLDSKKVITENNKYVIKRAEDLGNKIIISTGKVFKAARRLANEIGIKGPLISCNGAEIRDISSGELLYSNLLCKDDCYNVIEMCRTYDIYYHAYIEGDLYTEKNKCPTELYWRENTEVPEEYRIDIKVVPDFKEIVKKTKEGVSKFLIVSKDINELKRIRYEIDKINSVNVMCSGIDNLEVVDKEVSKGKAMKYISQTERNRDFETVVIGDSENDISMFWEADYKIAMGNADESLKRIADFITDSNDENGVAKAIESVISA